MLPNMFKLAGLVPFNDWGGGAVEPAAWTSGGDLNLAAQWADELVLLHRGRIAAQGTPQQVFVRDTLSSVFGSRFQLLETPEGRPVLVPR